MTINHIYNPRAFLRIFFRRGSLERGKKWRKKSERYSHAHTHTHTQVLKVSSVEYNNMCVYVLSRVWRGVGRSIKVEIYKTEPGGAIHGGRNGWRPARYVCYILLLRLLHRLHLILFFLLPTRTIYKHPSIPPPSQPYPDAAAIANTYTHIILYEYTFIIIIIYTWVCVWVCVYYISLSDIIHSRGTGCTSR